MVLRSGFIAVAQKLQEAVDSVSHNDVRSRLDDAIRDHFRGTDKWGYLVDYTGDGESGDVIYSCGGDMCRAAYESGTLGDKVTCHIDFENAESVVPQTRYLPEADEDDHYAQMTESLRASNIYTDLPLYERFISKKERDATPEEDFAGKGKSFPIRKPEDVGAAVKAMGRAGAGNYGTAELKRRIIAIAKRKGWTSSLPKTWQGSEAGVPRGTTETMDLRESAATLEPIVISEARSDYEIKLIAPGMGSSAFYPAEVLKRDGPKVFTKGTHVYLNHPTEAEEAARPENDVKNLAGVLTTTATYNESHAKGPGLYARMKVFADHAALVEEKAAHVGMSIRANGIAESGKTQGGLPVLKEFTSATSVDVVTAAGAGGMILTESARTDDQQEVSNMEAAKLEKLQESLTAGLAAIALREARADARDKATAQLEGLNLPGEAKTDIVARVVESVPMKDGALDEVKLTEMVKNEAQRIGRILTSVSGDGRVIGMGVSESRTVTPPKAEDLYAKDVQTFIRLGMSEAAAKAAVMGRAA